MRKSMPRNLTIQQEHLDFLRDNKIFLHASGRYENVWLKLGAPYNTHAQPAMMERYSAQFGGVALSSLGAFSYSAASLGHNATIGRYCAIGAGTKIMKASHPRGWIGMCGFDYTMAAPYGFYMRDKGIEAPEHNLGHEFTGTKVVIEDDVWIALDVTLVRKITIGQGAVIASGTTVTKDVPPYAIVAGNPGVVKRMRFSDKVIERMLESSWHRYDFTEFRGMETQNPERFLDSFEEAKASGRIKPIPEGRIDVHAEFRRISAELAAKAAATSPPVPIEIEVGTVGSSGGGSNRPDGNFSLAAAGIRAIRAFVGRA